MTGFRAAVAAAFVLSAVTVVIGGAGATLTASPSAVLSYHGLDADKVGTQYVATPDGKPDGHFTLTVDPGGESKTITELALMNYGAWDTVPQGSYAVLAVYRNGKRLNPADEAVSDAISGKTTYELYAGDYGYFGDPKDDR